MVHPHCGNAVVDLPKTLSMAAGRSASVRRCSLPTSTSDESGRPPLLTWSSHYRRAAGTTSLALLCSIIWIHSLIALILYNYQRHFPLRTR